jgi:hypothetical protein
LSFFLFLKWKQQYRTVSPTGAYSISSWVAGLLFTCSGKSWQTYSLSDANFGQKSKGFKIGSWVR